MKLIFVKPDEHREILTVLFDICKIWLILVGSEEVLIDTGTGNEKII